MLVKDFTHGVKTVLKRCISMGPSIKDVCLNGGGGQPNAGSCRQGGGGWCNDDVHILKNSISSFLKLLKQGIVYVIESR